MHFTGLILISLLGSPDYRARDAAEDGLVAMGEQALPHLLLGARWDGDPEIRLRCSRIIDLIRHSALDRLLARHHPVPWIDALPLDYPDRESVISLYLGAATGHDGGPDYPRYRDATRVFMRDRLDAGVGYAELWQLLGRMVERAKMWTGSGWSDLQPPS